MPQNVQEMVAKADGGVKPEQKKRGRKPKQDDKGKQDRKPPRGKAKAKAKAKAKSSCSKKKTKANKAKMPTKTDSSRRGRNAKIAQVVATPRKRQTLPKMSDVEKRALRSRQSSAYHRTRKQCLLDGVDPEEAKACARKVS